LAEDQKNNHIDPLSRKRVVEQEIPTEEPVQETSDFADDADENDGDFGDPDIPFGEDISQLQQQAPQPEQQMANENSEMPGRQPQPPKQSKIGDAKDKIKDLAKDKVKKEVEGKVKQQLLGLLLKNPYVLGTIAVIIGVIILAIILFAVFLKMSNSGASGSTQTVATNPVSDKDWIKQAALLSGDPALKQSVATDSFTELKNNLSKISQETTDVVNKKKIDDLITLITQYQANPTDSLQSDITKALPGVFDVMANPMPVFAGTGKKPLDNITGYNSEPFLKTVGSADTKATSGSAPYLQAKTGLCDAVSLYTDSAKSVYSPIPGTVTSVGLDGLNNNTILIKNGDWEVLIAHIRTSLSQGDMVTTDSIGTVVETAGSFQIQLEASYAGQCVTSTKYDLSLWKKDQTVDYGSYLWGHIIRVLKIG
jgi:hypothetical protein